MGNIDYIDSLKPGKRKNAFYIKTEAIDYEKTGIQSSKSNKVYIHVWDQKQKKCVGKLVDRY